MSSNSDMARFDREKRMQGRKEDFIGSSKVTRREPKERKSSREVVEFITEISETRNKQILIPREIGVKERW